MQDIIDLIDDNNLSEVFYQLDQLGTKSPIYAQLKQEYMSNRYGFEFPDRLKTFVRSLGNSQKSKPEPVSTNNSSGNNNIIIQNNSNSLHIGDVITKKEPEVSSKKKILLLLANPKDTANIDLPGEHSRLQAEMRAGKKRDDYEWLQPVMETTLKELMRALTLNPQIVHFSGHGANEGIYLMSGSGYAQLISTEILENLFSDLAGICECVLLNACYSATQAEVLSKFGFYVIGYNLPVGDGAAISFAEGFYLGLSEGKDILGAAKRGKVMLMAASDRSDFLLEVWKDGAKVVL